MHTNGKVIIAGAGPGDPELLTLKSLRAIERADIILYDALIHTEILKAAKPGCEFIFVGKRKGCHELPQQTINELLVKYSQKYGLVLRLKGGDPYVFGRGFEEYSSLISKGIDVEVIPGVSSAISGASCVGIPVTVSGLNKSFWVVTGTVSDGGISNDLELAARSTATIIIVMGMSQLDKIMRMICRLRTAQEPVAIIQDATTDRQRAVKGTAQNISEIANQYGIGAPAVFVVGKVVSVAELDQFLNTQEVKLRLAV